MNMIGLYQVAVLALMTAAISVTISKSRVFASAREWITARNTWFGELVSCSYCMSHWVAIVLVAIYRPVMISQWMFVDLIVSVFGVVAIAAIISGVIIKLNPFREADRANNVSRLRGVDNRYPRTEDNSASSSNIS